MNISGLLILPIYSFPSGLSYEFEVSLPSRGDSLSISWSGVSGDYQALLLSGGKIYHNSDMVGSHNGSVRVSGDIGGNGSDLYIGGVRVVLGDQRGLGKPIEALCVNPSASVSFDYWVVGQQLTPASGIDPLFEAGGSLTATISGLGLPFEVFSGYSLNDAFTLTGWDSGTGLSRNLYLQNTSFKSGINIIPLRLFTDFGWFDASFSSSGLSTGAQEITPFIMANLNLRIPNSGSSESYIRLFSYPGDAFDVRLDYLSGSGTYYKSYYASESVVVNVGSGVTGSGWLIVPASGTSGTYTNIYSMDIAPYSGVESLVGVLTSGTLSRFVYATGDFSIPFVGLATGYGTGSGYSGEASGIISGTHSITILDGSGYYVWSILASGSPSGGLCWNSGVELVPSGEFWGAFGGTYIATGYYYFDVSGNISGRTSGINYIQSFSGSWDLTTGTQPSGAVDFLENGYYGADNFHNTQQIEMPDYLHSFYLKITHNNRNNANTTACLSISGAHTQYYADLAGEPI